MHAGLREHLTLWISDERPGWPGADTSPALLLNRRDGRLPARGAHDILLVIAAEARLDPGFSGPRTAPYLRRQAHPRRQGQGSCVPPLLSIEIRDRLSNLSILGKPAAQLPDSANGVSAEKLVISVSPQQFNSICVSNNA